MRRQKKKKRVIAKGGGLENFRVSPEHFTPALLDDPRSETKRTTSALGIVGSMKS